MLVVVAFIVAIMVEVKAEVGNTIWDSNCGSSVVVG